VDFAFAPGEQSELKLLQRLLRDRVDAASGLDTTLVTGRTTVAEFLSHVDTTATKPTGDLLLGSHGNDTGWMEIDLDSAAERTVSYKVLKEAFEDPVRRNRLRIPPSLYTDAQGNPVAIRVLIRGCRIGQARKFVDGLKLLFGGQVPVVAAKHFLSVRYTDHRRKVRRKTTITPIGSFEYLAYSNEIVSKTALTRPQLLAAYRAKGFQQFDALPGSPNPIPDLWDKWLTAAGSIGIGKWPFAYRVSLGRDIGGLTTLSKKFGEFRHLAPKVTYRIENPIAAVKSIAGFKQHLSGRPEFQADWGPTDFPLHEQLGHADFDKWFESCTWTPSKDKNANPFVWVGQRHEYNMILPVVEPPMTGKDEKLIYNFFPPRGTGGTAFIELLESDTALFYTTP
jgi:hypothetical protein